MNILRLWQTFLDNVDPLIKLFHTPSVQRRLLEVSDNLEKVPKNLEVLMFGIYATATASLNREECQGLFGEDKDVVLTRFQSGARQALQNAYYLRSSDMVVLQGFGLYLVTHHGLISNTWLVLIAIFSAFLPSSCDRLTISILSNWCCCSYRSAHGTRYRWG